MVVVERSHQAFLHAFALQPQHHYRIHAFQHRLEIIAGGAARQGRILRQQRRRDRRRGFRPVPSVRSACRSERATRECLTSPTINTFSFEKSAPLAWRRVSTSSKPWVGCALRPSPALTRAVPSPACCGQRFSRAVFGMAHDETAHAHCLQVLQRIQRRLALARGGGGGVEIEHIRTQSLRRDLERTARARGRLEEQRADRGSQQRVPLLRASQCRVADLAGAVQQAAQGLLRQPFQGQQVAQASVGIELQGHARFPVMRIRFPSQQREARPPVPHRAAPPASVR